MTRVLFIPAVLALCVGCKDKKAVQAPAAAPPSATSSAEVAPPAAAVSPNVAVSNDLARECSLHLSSVEHAPKFGYNQDHLLPQDRDVLEKVATCVTTGPLKGRKLELVGRADPRGTDEYNLGLGTRRANTVIEFLRRLGVRPDQLAGTTRGDLDAAGGDERGWQVDRRVDVVLVN